MAYLKSLELTGFKSFPDKVNISFNDGICAIVGPNGSGKSNICDAIRWVFGEQSAKTLRGDKMEDVIFGGTQKRKPVGFAEVTLTIDNSSGMLKSGYSEISVTRRYYRSGESEYYINRAPVRLKDVNELFMDTGLGRDGYSIIGQGRIAEILSQKGQDRRLIFEEAAGISKYRYKKIESERKLKAAQENLVRLSDIVSSLTERLSPLESQSKKAKQYLFLRDKLREAEVTVWLNSSDKIKENEKILEKDISNLKEELKAKKEEASNADKMLDELYEKQRKADMDINTKRTSLQNLKLDIQKQENDISIMQNTLQRNESDMVRLDVQREARKEKSEDNSLLIEKANSDISDLSELLREKEIAFSALLQSRERVTNDLSNKIKCIESLRAEIEKKSDSISVIREKISSLDSKIALRENQQDHTQETIMFEEKQISEVTLQLKEAQAKIEQIKRDIAEVNDQYQSENKDLMAIISEIHRNEEQLALIQKADAGAQARLAMLTELKNELEGFSNSVKFVIRQSKEGRLIGIEGTVAELFSVDEKNAVAIEVALGGAIQNVVTRDEQAAKEAIQRLKNLSRGRATFLPLTSIKGKKQNFQDLASCKGYIACALDVIKSDERYNMVFAYLLGRTALFDNLDNAVLASKKTGYVHRIVTLDGQIINAGGAMMGGSFNRNTGILSRAGEMVRLNEECKKREVEISNLKFLINEEKQNELNKKSSVKSLSDRRLFLDTEISKYESEARYLIKAFNDAKARLDEVKAQSCNASGQVETDKKEKLDMEAMLEEKVKHVGLLRSKLSGLNNEHAALEIAAKQAEKEISEARLALELVKKDIDTIKQKMKSYELQSGELLKEDAEFQSEKARINRENEELKNAILKKSDDVSKMKKLLENEDKALNQMAADRLSSDKETVELSKLSKELLHRKGELERELIRLETKLESSLLEFETIAQKLWDNYELTPVAAEKYRISRDEITQSKAQTLASDLKRQISALGNINLDSIDEYLVVKEKLEFLKTQTEDLIKAKNSLETIISGLTRRMKEIFTDQFKLINSNFSQTFTELFGGGRAWLELEDEHDVLNCGIEIHVQPPGKNVKSISLLSGGEQAFTAIAILFAMLKIRPTPFCVLDEVEAALDEVNVTRFASYIEAFKKKTQFVVITHRRGTMEFADMLYGVTMQEKGVSKLLSINVRDVAKQMNILQ